MIEEFGSDYIENLESPRLLKTHLPIEDIAFSSTKGKYIYVTRNPKDALLSYFNHHKMFNIYDWKNGKFEAFFKMFLEDRMPCGNYFDHLNGFLQHKNEANVLFIKYEDLLADLVGGIREIGEFIGGRAAEVVKNPVELMKIVNSSTADSMKENQAALFPAMFFNDNKPTFIKNACSKKWKKVFTKQQSDIVDYLFDQKLADTEAANWWEEELQWEDFNSRTMG